MEPFYFGEPGGQLLGLYHPPAGVPRAEGVVICAPLFSEYFRSHSCLRRLAMALAARGLHVLRFDYYGTGDSNGEFESTTPDDWQANIGTAIAELEAISGVRQIRLVGVRFGATLAARVALDVQAIDRIVLWDPIADGAAYVRQLRATHERLLRAHGLALPLEEPSLNDKQELVGVPVSQRLVERLESVSLPRWSDLPRRPGTSAVLVLSRNDSACDAVVDDPPPGNVSVHHVDFDCDWSTYTETVLFPHDIINVLSNET